MCFNQVVLKSLVLTTSGTTSGFFKQGSYIQGVFATGCLTTRDFYMRGCYDQEFLLPGVFTTWGCFIETYSFQGYNVQGSYK